jgi:hypothetical protein
MVTRRRGREIYITKKQLWTLLYFLLLFFSFFTYIAPPSVHLPLAEHWISRDYPLWIGDTPT